MSELVNGVDPVVLADPAGSKWRRWDPHVHMPGTLKNNQFGSMTVAEALNDLAACDPSIVAAGITDYCSTHGFRDAWQAWQQGAGSGLALLFPNVELRLEVPTSKKGLALNLHLLCGPDQVDDLDQFLGLLTFAYESTEYPCTTAGLIALGRAFRGESSLDKDTALRVGVDQFKVSFTQLRSKFESNRWARENCLVGVAGGRDDGTSGLQTGDNSFDGLRQSIERLAHIIFSSNQQQRDFWLGQGAASLTELTKTYGGPKACLHGSDAHDASHLGKPDEDRFCWLKGDATFESLRMACLAPDTRIVIGSQPPNEGFSHGRISSVAVSGKTPFISETIPINPGLVAIIGARGSGKTALADIIAVGAGSVEPFEDSKSFVMRANRLLNDSIVSVGWTQGETSSSSFAHPESDTEPIERGVRYLSQQFVERLCSADGVSSDLLAEIERVVFNAWPSDQRLGTTSFAELLKLRLAPAKQAERAQVEAIRDLGEEIADQHVLSNSKERKVAERSSQQKLLVQAETQINDLVKQSEKGDAKRLAEINDALEQRRSSYQLVDRQIRSLESLVTEVATARQTTFPRYQTRLQSENRSAGFEGVQWQSFGVEFVGAVDDLLTKSIESARKSASTIAGTSSGEPVPPLEELSKEELTKKSIAELTAEQLRLQKLVGLDTRRTRQLQAANQRQSTLRNKIAKLDEEIKLAENASAQIAALTDKRFEHYAAYFDALLREKKILEELYAPLSSVLASGGSAVSKLKFSVRRVVDIDGWATEGEEKLIDLRTSGPFQGSGRLAAVARQELLEAWQNGDGDTAASAIRNFASHHSGDIRKHSKVKREDDEEYRAWERRVAKWLYSADHVSLTYSLEYDGLNIERLSPGTRGIVLLLLYLAVDQEETDPLIIDQPEENLDPKSVYSELVGLFRDAADRRQIIMVTHNANLVVNTDVDQVIIAKCGSLAEGRLPEVTYETGGLEQAAIRQAVCEVLEGGADAFRQRARRLRIELHVPESDEGEASQSGDAVPAD
jgi:AAA domain, putative AbiEii toxin, Type IV TA system